MVPYSCSLSNFLSAVCQWRAVVGGMLQHVCSESASASWLTVEVVSSHDFLLTILLTEESIEHKRVVLYDLYL